MVECVFCKIARGEIKQDFFATSNHFLAFFDISPKAEGHTLIISKQHYVTLLDLPIKLGNELIEFMKNVAGKLLDEKYGDGFNLLMNNLEVAGQVVMHAHLHVIPRNENDGLRVIS